MTNYQECKACGRDDISLETPDACMYCPHCGADLVLQDIKGLRGKGE